MADTRLRLALHLAFSVIILGCSGDEAPSPDARDAGPGPLDQADDQRPDGSGNGDGPLADDGDAGTGSASTNSGGEGDPDAATGGTNSSAMGANASDGGMGASGERPPGLTGGAGGAGATEGSGGGGGLGQGSMGGTAGVGGSGGSSTGGTLAGGAGAGGNTTGGVAASGGDSSGGAPSAGAGGVTASGGDSSGGMPVAGAGGATASGGDSSGGMPVAGAGGDGVAGTASGGGAGGAGGDRGQEFVTLLGGSQPNGSGRDVAIAADGSIFVTGGIRSRNSGFVTTIGPDTYDGPDNDGDGQYNMDVLLAKFSPEGTLLFSRVLGSPQYDRAYAIEVDANGDVFVGGRAGEGMATTAGALQAQFAGDLDPSNLYGRQDGFITKVSGVDGSILWSTYFGTPGHDVMRDIDVTPNGDVYVSQIATRETTYIKNPGVLEASKPYGNGNPDIIIARIAPDGTAVEFAGWLGGDGNDTNPVIRVSDSGDLFLLMGTDSTDLPLSPSPLTPFQSSFQGGGSDLYLARFAGDVSALRYGTYVGTSGNEGVETHQMDVNPNDEAVIGCGVENTELPLTTGPTTVSGARDMYVAVMSEDGSSVVAGRLFGGNGVDFSEGLSVDSQGRVLTGGGTDSTDLPTTPGAFQTSFGQGRYDGIIVAFSPNLESVLLATYVGGSGDFDGMRGSAFDELNNAAVTFGQADSNDFPTTANAYQKTTTGAGDAALARFLLP